LGLRDLEAARRTGLRDACDLLGNAKRAPALDRIAVG